MMSESGAAATEGKMQQVIETKVVPALNKVTSNYWFSLVADAVLIIVPFSMVSAIPSLWSVIRKFLLPNSPDLTPIMTYSFGLIGLFVSFIIPYNCMVKEERKERSLIAGFTGLGTFMLCMNAQTTDAGTVFTMAQFGAGGMFTAMFLGLMVAFIYKLFATRSFFSEDSLIPDFVRNWFDNIIAILISLFIGWIVTYLANVNIFSLITYVMSPLTYFAQTLPGVIFMTFIMDFFYFFGVSGWVFTPVTRTIQQMGMAKNMAAVAAGGVATNINAYGFTRYTMIGGKGATLPLAFYLTFLSKSKKNKLLGKATFVPVLFNINEPIWFSTVVDNPYMLVTTILESIILPANAWVWQHFGWAGCHYVNFDANQLPTAVSAFFMSGGNWGNVVLVLVNLALAAIIWFPFFEAYDKHQCEIEAAEEQEIEAQES